MPGQEKQMLCSNLVLGSRRDSNDMNASHEFTLSHSELSSSLIIGKRKKDASRQVKDEEGYALLSALMVEKTMMSGSKGIHPSP
jgi:hypothetical protein